MELLFRVNCSNLHRSRPSSRFEKIETPPVGKTKQKPSLHLTVFEQLTAVQCHDRRDEYSRCADCTVNPVLRNTRNDNGILIDRIKG